MVLAPLFPAGIDRPRPTCTTSSSSNTRASATTRCCWRWSTRWPAAIPVDGEKFYLHGFSGGGQFAHRFFYLHPDRLAGVSIGAPGRITQLDDTPAVVAGHADLEQRFGRAIDLDALRRVPVLMVVGDDDVETWEIDNPGESNWMDGAEETGGTRIERLHTLERDFLAHGIDVRFALGARRRTPRVALAARRCGTSSPS